MPTYYVNEAVFALPERGFVDRTVHMLESPLSGDDRLSVAIRRLPLPEGKTLRELVDEEIAATTAKTKSFTILDDAEVSVADVPTIVLRARWRAGDLAQYQRQAHVAFDGTWIALAVAGPSTDRAACDETFDRIVHTLTWRRG
ncbi:MAG: DcrB-related protein [Minicystis sp.]